ncbi:uncharacterized protein K460DRAFT_275099 [Cucurbitaria berberidis CBS 394.84]|uniref:PH domain-containing protein n=1 Tax=Cucurbitaria berberidis CBS 394.84 TaxID=1168544 RepID=A0A9P4LCX6_9PLEO|nr:uncharacterized protein K460DRAFT_275099 [Cucurbitaria berberidis CBS 394.84]KAF1850475.1 hypothetical protein K460DRAFT_275099 [Cucurbitaria berberidis CBS 394.84]
MAPESSSTSRWRFNRSTTNLLEVSSRQAPTNPIPRANTPAPKLERPPSKMSLFSLFSRPKVERARGHTSEVGIAVPMRPQTPPRAASPVSAPKSSLRLNPSPPAQQTIRSRSSQMFRPMSMRPTPTPTPSQREFGSWDPPPLFQAFPQSLKHATLQACVFPPEVLMRTQSQRQHAELLRDRMDSARDLSTIAENDSLEKTHKRLISNSALNPPTPELVNKIYMLVTAGFVLQYGGDGSFDRLPEKVLKLGKDSAAFACDLIPGKHWVLQISSRAHDDGTVEPEPKHNLLSRLRSQNATTKKSATNFLLVLESAEEMDEWMTTVRKEIDNMGGMKVKEDATRASSSTDGSTEKKSTDTASHRYLVHRDPNVITKVAPPIDSPPQSQYSASPRIVTSDWETDRSVRTASIAESSSGQSSRRDNNTRQSVDMSSVASTPVSQHQLQLDQLRGRSRSSFMSTTTATSGPGTRNTSREPSPAPQSPLKESFSPIGEAEPLRTTMSLKSFHMNPSNNGTASRRRSVQPLPVTNENLLPPIQVPISHPRHSFYSPTSPTVPELGKPGALGPAMTSKVSVATSPLNDKENTVAHITSCARSTTPKLQTNFAGELSITPEGQTREDSPVKCNTRSYGSPPRRNTISPPPNGPAPLPPQSGKRQSVFGTPAMSNQSAAAYSASSPTARTQRRLSATPKPFFRPFPIRPQAQHSDAARIVPRRQSSLTPTSAPAPLPLGINVSRSVTAPARSPSAAANMTPTSHPNNLHFAPNTLRRPNSVIIRSDPAPFLSSSRPVRAIQSTPSFVPGRRASNVPTSAPRQWQPAPSIDTLRQQALAHQAQEHAQQKAVLPGGSMPAMGLPPRAPPPNMPLPPPPPSMPLPMPPLSMPLPTPPPNMPLPPPPPMSTSRGVAV